MDWSPIVTRFKDSVLQIIAHHAKYDICRPYAGPAAAKGRGSGFIVDIDRGLIVTNAHVVENAITILARSPRTGKEYLNLNLIGICRDRDLAICQLDNESRDFLIEDIEYPKCLNMKLGDEMELRQTEEVIAIGYPLGKENIKITTGVVSGFQHENNPDEELGIQHPNYIQITAALNPGNSGGPLLNRKGLVVGVNGAGYLLMQNVGYAIGSRVLISIFESMIANLEPVIQYQGKIPPILPLPGSDGGGPAGGGSAGGTSGSNGGGPLVLNMPKFSFKWNQSNNTINTLKCGNAKFTGIYVRKVLPDSIFENLEEGDIICRLTYYDPFWASEEAFDITDIGIRTNLLKKPKLKIWGHIDNFGDISLSKSLQRLPEDMLLNRKIQLEELRNIIPVGACVELQVCKNNKKWYSLKSMFEPVLRHRLKLHFPHFEIIPYFIFAGIVVSPLTLNHVKEIKNLSLFKYTDDQHAFKQYLVVVQVFPNTHAYHVGTLQVGDILDSVNGVKVTTMTELDGAIRATGVYSSAGDTISIKTRDHKYFMVDKSIFVPEDLAAIDNFKIRGYRYHFG